MQHPGDLDYLHPPFREIFKNIPFYSKMPELMLMPNNPLSHRPRHSTDIGRRNPQGHPTFRGHPPVVRPPPARSTPAARPSPPVCASPALLRPLQTPVRPPRARSPATHSPGILPPAGAAGTQVHDGLSPTAVSVLSSQDGEIDISGGTFNAVKGNQNHVTVQVHVNGVGEGLTAAEPLCKASMPVKSERPQPSSPTFSPDASLERNGSVHSLQPRSSQLMIPEQSINDVYYRLLSSKKRGSPLWIPTTNKRLPVEYQRNGLGIGDVGVITDRGFFDSLFNITHPRDHPLAINSDRLPSDFDPLNIAPNDIQEYSEFKQGSHLSSASIKNSYKDDNSSGLVFESSAAEGAILTLPYGSNSEDLGNKKKLQDYLSVHGEEMYRCALNQHGRIIKNGDLRVITGYDKTTNWGMAAFSNSSDRPDTESFCLKFRPKDPRVGGRTHSWESSGSAEVKAGPDMREIVALRRGDPSQQDIEYENQAVFIRTENITLSKETWNKLLSDSGTGDIEIDKESSSHPSSSHSARPTGSSGSSSQSSSNSENHSSRSTGSQTTHSSLSNTLTVHPSNGINEILLKFNPQARMAITGDECWISVLKEEDLVLPPVKQLWARIEQSFVVREEDGVVFLERSIVQTSTLPTSSLMNTCLAIGSANTQLPADAVDRLSPTAHVLTRRNWQSPNELTDCPFRTMSVLSSQDGEIDISGGTFNAVKGNHNRVTVQVHVNGVGEGGPAGQTVAEPLCSISIPVKSERPKPSPTCLPDAELERKGSRHSLQPCFSQSKISEQSINYACYRHTLIKEIALLVGHSKDIIHGDLKGVNILDDDGEKALLSDFGLSRVKADLNSGSTGNSAVVVDSPHCTAPEREPFNYKRKFSQYANIHIHNIPAVFKPSRTINSYSGEFPEVIGAGGFGTVYRGSWNREKVALKVMKETASIVPRPAIQQFTSRLDYLKTHACFGSPRWMAPELFNLKEDELRTASSRQLNNKPWTHDVESGETIRAGRSGINLRSPEADHGLNNSPHTPANDDYLPPPPLRFTTEVFKTKASSLSAVARQALERIPINALSVILNKCAALDIAGQSPPGHLWLVTYSSPNVALVLSCTDRYMGKYPIFIVDTNAMDDNDFAPSIQLLARRLQRYVAIERVYSVFDPVRIPQFFSKTWTQVTLGQPEPQPYYDAKISCLWWHEDLKQSIESSTFKMGLAGRADIIPIAKLCYSFANDSPPFTSIDEAALVEARKLVSSGQLWTHKFNKRVVPIAAFIRIQVETIIKVYTDHACRGHGCTECLHCNALLQDKGCEAGVPIDLNFTDSIINLNGFCDVKISCLWWHEDLKQSIESSTFKVGLAGRADIIPIAKLWYSFANDSPPFTLSDEAALVEARKLVSSGQLWTHKFNGRVGPICSFHKKQVATITKVYTDPACRGTKCLLCNACFFSECIHGLSVCCKTRVVRPGFPFMIYDYRVEFHGLDK